MWFGWRIPLIEDDIWCHDLRGSNTGIFWVSIESMQNVNSDNYNEIYHQIGNWEEYHLWDVIFGFHKENSFLLIAFLLIAYNVIRAVVTFKVSSMYYDQERTGITPGHSHPFKFFSDPINFVVATINSYDWLLKAHKMLNILFWIALVSGLYTFIKVLSIPVKIPVDIFT